MRTRVLLGSSVLILLAALFCAGLAMVYSQGSGVQEGDLLLAKQRWETNGSSSYRMVLEEANCVTDYQVRGGRVVWGYETPCGRYGRTVPSLFALVQDYAIAKPECFGPACRCQRITTLNVRYDATLGFPEHIHIQMREWPNWQSAAFWQAAMSRMANPCNQTGAWKITVQGLKPE
jgi:Family of unknown function (DUF6174)